ncbi:MAG: zf-TFIIB domain-containing protein [Desulfomonile sp.]|jgi:Zn-finger nucleic acid-binding protein
MLCPICNVDLLLSERQGVEIDYCPKCRGIWLDRGELEKLIEKSNSEAQSFPHRDNRDPRSESYQKSDDHHGKRKGSWFSRALDY